MAVEFEVQGSRTSEYRFLPQHVEVDPQMNGRHEVPDVEPLIQSILLHGQLQPVTIRRTARSPVLVAGFSRWRAVSEINKRKLTEKPLELRCSYTVLNEKQAFLANIEENRVRNATTPMDDAYNLQRLINVFQMTEAECAESYRASKSWVRSRLALIEATPEVEKQIRAGKIKGPAAVAVAKVSKEHQRNLAKVAEAKGNVTMADVHAEVGKAQKAPKAELNGYASALAIGDDLARHIVRDDLSLDKAEGLAKSYLKARGIQL